MLNSYLGVVTVYDYRSDTPCDAEHGLILPAGGLFININGDCPRLNKVSQHIRRMPMSMRASGSSTPAIDQAEFSVLLVPKKQHPKLGGAISPWL